MYVARVATQDGTVTYAVVHGLDEHGIPTKDTVVDLLKSHPFGDLESTGVVLPLGAVKVLAPVLPSKIVCIGKNYADHAREMGGTLPTEPVIFIKPNTAVIGPNDTIRLPWQSERVDHEAELGFIIGRIARNVAREDAAQYILGYTLGNDVTARDLQQRDVQWTRAKGFDTFCPLGPWIVNDFDPANAAISCVVDGEVRQSASTADMVRDCHELLEFVSSVMTLLPGDVILTGTPAGISQIKDGQTVTVAIDGLGALTNPVKA
jgi:2-keto-4-pentenoate hydratase/2-oxohepta-3-ene-1,7-dioic acid hydratase in catechol pathway